MLYVLRASFLTRAVASVCKKSCLGARATPSAAGYSSSAFFSIYPERNVTCTRGSSGVHAFCTASKFCKHSAEEEWAEKATAALSRAHCRLHCDLIFLVLDVKGDSTPVCDVLNWTRASLLIFRVIQSDSDCQRLKVNRIAHHMCKSNMCIFLWSALLYYPGRTGE